MNTKPKFDPYHKWFGIPAHVQPPNHYRLLRIDLFESDPEVIENAYNKEMADLKAQEHGQQAEFVDQLSREIIEARACLLSAEKKTAYDTKLAALKKNADDARQQTEQQLQLDTIEKAVRSATTSMANELNRLRALTNQTSYREQQALAVVQHLRKSLELLKGRSRLGGERSLPVATPFKMEARESGSFPVERESNPIVKARPVSVPPPRPPRLPTRQAAEVAEPNSLPKSKPLAKLRSGRKWQLAVIGSACAILLLLAIGLAVLLLGRSSESLSNDLAQENQEANTKWNSALEQTFASESLTIDTDTRSPVAARHANIVISATELRKLGGTDESEAAVASALKWLAEHQQSDGSWSFDHRQGEGCKGRCSHPGSLTTALNAATAMALLPFIAAGHTHQKGQYKTVVSNGIKFLLANQKSEGGGGSFREFGGNMYSHGLAAIVLTEAYARTKDTQLLAPAQASLNYIVYAQDPVGGGWRYSPRQAGDASVTGWQITALKNGQTSNLTVPAGTIRGAVKLLDNVSAESGAFYGYTGPGRGKATTAIGLLMRTYTGWKKDNPALERGVQWIGAQGPSISGNRASMYYNYYANQLLFHQGGEIWDKWNNRLRDALVTAQEKDTKSHECGSWYFTGDQGAERGGRLYATSLATLCLEVYYR